MREFYEAVEAVRFADDYAGIFAQVFAIELPFQELGRPAQSTERVLDFMGKLPDHLPACAVLIDERVFPADPRTTRDIVHFNQDPGLL